MGFHMGYYYRLPLNTLEVIKEILTKSHTVCNVHTTIIAFFFNLQNNTIAINYAILRT